VQVPEEYEVDKTITVPKVIQEEREIRIPVPQMVKKTIRVPKQRVITEHDEVSPQPITFLIGYFLVLASSALIGFDSMPWFLPFVFDDQHTVTVHAMEEHQVPAPTTAQHTATYQTGFQNVGFHNVGYQTQTYQTQPGYTTGATTYQFTGPSTATYQQNTYDQSGTNRKLDV
jgi:hypothetical protein